MEPSPPPPKKPPTLNPRRTVNNVPYSSLNPACILVQQQVTFLTAPPGAQFTTGCEPCYTSYIQSRTADLGTAPFRHMSRSPKTAPQLLNPKYHPPQENNLCQMGRTTAQAETLYNPVLMAWPWREPPNTHSLDLQTVWRRRPAPPDDLDTHTHAHCATLPSCSPLCGCHLPCLQLVPSCQHRQPLLPATAGAGAALCVMQPTTA
jgi:hypothetical protein